ncbi:MAG TPA: hypothetical protein DEQ38_09230 [Elusimicrobia bacterium]|nr:MAG: hypothetical protein A2089_13785 [Elusimicrobia bacterium GWD2_63_28]HCC48276.1 hypothetical protein [Elusimicrobiota bacterium]
MRKAAALALLLPACAGFYSCSGSRPAAQGELQAPHSGPSAATVFEKRTFKLVKTPDPDLEAALEGLLSASYDTAVRKHAESSLAEIGFTYSLSPRGAVYPFSEIEVSCILQEKYAPRSGPALCGDFFTELDGKIKKAVAGKQ